MPQKKIPELTKEPVECVLRYGKSNNVVQWSEEMQTEVTALYGLTGMFFTTNKSYKPPRVSEDAILQSFYESEGEEDENDEEVDNDGEDEDPTPQRMAALAAAAAAKSAAKANAKAARIKKDEKILTKIREFAHEARRKAVVADAE